MRRTGCIVLTATALLTTVTGCRKTPEGVIPPDDMAALVADTYMLEGVVDQNITQYPADSSRLLLKRSLYAARGYDQAQVDTSLAWYGRNIEVYVEVCDKAIEILQDRQHDLASANTRAISVAGDSVNVWPGTSHLTVGRNLPSRYLTFDIPADSNWHKGDIYELRYKLVNSNRGLRARMLVDYADGQTDYNETAGQSQGTTKLKLRIDSTRTPQRLYGYIDLGEQRGESFHIDSLTLVRTRKHLGSAIYVANRHFKWGETRRDTARTATHDTGLRQPGSQQASADMPLPASILP